MGHRLDKGLDNESEGKDMEFCSRLQGDHPNGHAADDMVAAPWTLADI